MNPALALSFLTPSAPAPQAHILVDCLEPTCEALILDASLSSDADDYTWSVDGVVVSNDEVAEFTIANDLHTITLDVAGPGGSDSQQRFVVQGTSTSQVQEVTEEENQLLVVAGVTSCSGGNLIISTIGGCFTNAKIVTHAVDHLASNSVSKFEYNRTSDAVSRFGQATAAVSYEFNFQNVMFHGPSINPNNHQPGKAYPPTVHTTSQNVTSYLPIQTGHSYVISSGYVADVNNVAVAGKSIKLSCPSASGQPNVSLH